MQVKRKPLSTQQLIGIAVFFATGPLLALSYWQNGDRSTYLGVLPFGTLVFIASVRGAVSFPLYVGTRGRFLAVIPGAFAGFGAFELHVLYTTWQQKDMMNTGESLVIAAVGAAPGMLLCWGLVKLFAKKESKDLP